MQADQHIEGQPEGLTEGQDKESAGRIAVIVGVTGLIGSHLLDRILQSNRYRRVVAIARSSAPDSVRKYIDSGQLIWQSFSESMPDHVDHFFCALGTTQKVAGKAGLAAVDRDLVVETASVAIANGASLCSVVSATGADARSIFFYNRIKGEMEAEVSELGSRCVQFWQPSVLLGERSEDRFAEKIAGCILRSPLPKNIQARDGAAVASAMVVAAGQNLTGIHRFKVREIDMFNSGETL
ncbi:NAD dependent epimerase/dehydratase family protein [Thalassolituus maritimus]|uniref:NAD dependent epimerase/dehydratase family protein n=1 Tax=Thalassolituus maritimus TaxID=484498 RepID=A0A1N7L8F0_9GAMM|nr:NAD-dependent epimerase/dehydratase family protein [Thalassolituus maritimus]SIS70063.1 NAD dependent epimerase/dehydratase family protein [Thalassolituus maritimus]